MKIPKKVVFDFAEEIEPEPVIEYCIMPSGDYVVRTEDESFWFDSRGVHPKSHLIFEEDPNVDRNLVTITQQSDGKTLTYLNISDTGIDYRHLGLMVCDLVRHIAGAFKVQERAVWEWVFKEKDRPTTRIIENSKPS